MDEHVQQPLQFHPRYFSLVWHEDGTGTARWEETPDYTSQTQGFHVPRRVSGVAAQKRHAEGSAESGAEVSRDGCGASGGVDEDMERMWAVDAFLRRHGAVAALLHEGLYQFDLFCGRRVTINLELCQGADDAVLRVVWHLRPHEDGAQLLRTFDTCWWLQECHRSEGRLVFDYVREGPVAEEGT